MQLLRVKTDFDGQCAQHLPVNLNRDVDIAFHSHPVGHLNTHVRIKTDKSTSERRKLPQSN